MSDRRVFPGAPSGTVCAPPSKSAAHRALICAALTGRGCRVFPISGSADMEATLGVLAAMGARFTRDGAAVVFDAPPGAGAAATLNCIESGSTLRFLLPVAAALGLGCTFTGEGRLPERPVGALAEQMERHGVSFSSGRMPFSISGRLTGGRYELPGDVSSQFVSGLFFALPLVPEDSEILLTSPLQSAGYVEMTLSALSQSGIKIQALENGYHVPGGQRYRMTPNLRAFAGAGAWRASGGAAFRPGDKPVEGDWSNAAFWLCAGAIGGEITVEGLDMESVQGDRAILGLLRRFGAKPRTAGGGVGVRAAPLHGIRIDAGPIPDLVPILAVTAAFARGDTEIYNAARLRIKESDRLASVRAMLGALGGAAEEYPDRLIVHGVGLRGGEVDGMNDHRIVMSAAIAGLFCRGPVLIRGAGAVRKSYPEFFEELKKLGGVSDVI